MLDGGPHVLQGSAHLQFETDGVEFGHCGVIDYTLGQTTNIVERVVAETVKLMELSFIHRLFPIDIEGALGNGRHLIHIIGVEGDDADTHEICQIVDVVILVTFAFELTR